MACAVSKTVIETIIKEGLVERAATLGERWTQDLRSLAVGHEVIEDVRGRGLMIGVEMGEEAKRYQEFALREGVLVNVASGKVVRMIPPLIIGESSIARANELLRDFLER